MTLTHLVFPVLTAASAVWLIVDLPGWLASEILAVLPVYCCGCGTTLPCKVQHVETTDAVLITLPLQCGGCGQPHTVEIDRCSQSREETFSNWECLSCRRPNYLKFDGQILKVTRAMQ